MEIDITAEEFELFIKALKYMKLFSSDKHLYEPLLERMIREQSKLGR